MLKVINSNGIGLARLMEKRYRLSRVKLFRKAQLLVIVPDAFRILIVLRLQYFTTLV